MPVSTRHKDKGSSSSGGGKAHTMPPPQPEPGMTKEQMMAPAPILIPGRLRDEKAAGARFNNIIHFGGQRAKDLTKDVKGQTQELLQHLDQLLSENMTDKTKIVNCHIFVKDKASFNDMCEVWEKWVDPKFPPACTFGIAEFLDENVAVQIAPIAVVCRDYGEEVAEEDVEMQEEETKA